MKKLNKFFAVLVALAMMAMLSVTAFAANPVATSTEAGKKVDTKITKAYNKADGVGNPTNQAFSFTAVPVANVEGYNTHSANVTANVNGGTLTVDDLFKDTTFTNTGKYRFEVTEDLPSGENVNTTTREVVYNNTTNDDFTVKETTTYSNAKYRVDLVVASYTDPNTLQEKKYVQSAAVYLIQDDNGNTANAGKPDSSTYDGDGIMLKFTNKVNKEIIRDPNDQTPTTKDEDKAGLEISKTVTNKDPEKAANPAQEFNFKATVTWPANTKQGTYTAVVKEMKDGNVNVTETVVTFTKGDNNADSKTFKLKAGQWLAFTDIEAGATVALSEDIIPGFEAKDLPDDAYVVKDDASNAIDVTNEWDESAGSVTGILMSNIPYIVLALVAIGGLCAYVVVRRKNADEA